MHINGPVVPRAATAIDRIPDETACPGGCRYEPKWDGFRALAIVNPDGGVRLWSRHQKPLNDAFPEIVLAVFDALPPGTVVDGEIVRWGRDGRLDFAALQRRHIADHRRRDLALSQPCHYVVFDLLEASGTDYRPRPLTERRQALEHLLADVPDSSRIVLCPQMRDIGEARLWFEILPAQGIEGLVVKPAGGRYREGKRGWWKVKHRATTEAIMGGVTGTTDEPQSLILGRYDPSGRLRVVARTSPLTEPARHELAALLTPAADDHPWPLVLLAGWAGGMPGAEPPTPYVRVVPNLVAEISVDAAVEHGRWRHSARYLRLRHDLTPDDVPTNLDLQ
jgi:ATP-dependent DNA ligase